MRQTRQPGKGVLDLCRGPANSQHRMGRFIHTSLYISAVFMACLAAAPDANSQPEFTTKYVYYAIGGNTPLEIYRSMLKRGPRVDGAKAYAATSAESAQSGKLQQGDTCHIEDYRLRIDFEIKLPRIKNEKILSSGDQSRWQEFARFLKKHEETHRSIWLACAAELETKIHTLKATTCAEVEKKSQSLWEATRKACSKKHDAFDAAEQKKLMQRPFVKLVYKKSLQTRAAKAN